MSSISSYDVYIDDHDDNYIKKFDDLESGSAGSGSGSDDIYPILFKTTPVLFKSKIEENELDVIRIYLKCQKNAFNFASQHNKKYAVIMCGLSMLLSGSLIFIPFISPHVDEFVSSSISLVLFFSLCYSKYSNFEIHQQQYKIISNKYAGMHSNVESFLAKFVYMTDKHTAFYEKIKEIETKLNWVKEDSRELLPYFIRVQLPFVSGIDIFQSIHGIEIEQNTLVSRYHNVKNEIDVIKGNGINRDESRMKYLKENKKKIKESLKTTNYSDIKEQLDNEYNRLLIQYDC